MIPTLDGLIVYHQDLKKDMEGHPKQIADLVRTIENVKTQALSADIKAH